MPFPKSITDLARKNQLRLYDGQIKCRANLADDITYNKYGEIVIKITIPFDEVEEAAEIRRLVGLPVNVTFELWKPFAEFVRTGELPDHEDDV